MIKYILLMLFSGIVSAKSIQLTWDHAELRADGTNIEQREKYVIYYGFGLGEQISIDIDANDTSYTLPDVFEGTYYFQIATVEAGQEGEKSDPLPVTVAANAKPSKMTITGNNLTIEIIE